MAKGSLSVFFALIMTAVMGLIFTMGECVRLYELNDFAQEYTDMAAESAFSEYNPYLWANYNILAIDLGYGSDIKGPGIMEQKTLDYCKYNSSVESGHNFARLAADSCLIQDYALLSDNDGAGLMTLGIKAAKEGLAKQVIDGIQTKVDTINNIEKVPVEDRVNTGKRSLDEAKAANSAAKYAAEHDDNPDTHASDIPEPGQIEENPLDIFEILKGSFSKSILASVTDVEKVSEAEMELAFAPSHRKLQQGTMDMSGSRAITDKALYIDYLITNFGYFGNSAHDGMKYEVEYLLSGKHSDPQALASVVEQILLVREAANYFTIEHTPSLEIQAEGVASAIAAFSGNPAVVGIVKRGIIAAWAYAESTLDLRLILSGGKVPAVKNLDQWTSDVWHLAGVTNVNYKAKDCGEGISYRDYLIAFLALRSNATLNMRGLDIIENALNSTEDYKDVKVDNLLFAANIQMGYSAEEMFLSLFSGTAPSQDIGTYFLQKEKFISY